MTIHYWVTGSDRGDLKFPTNDANDRSYYFNLCGNQYGDDTYNKERVTCARCLALLSAKSGSDEQRPAYSAPASPGAEAPKADPVSSPAHYTRGKIECIDAIDAAIVGLTSEEGFYVGQVLKYVWRWKTKNGVEDLKKAKWYLERLIEKVSK